MPILIPRCNTVPCIVYMMVSWHENAFRLTGSVWRESAYYNRPLMLIFYAFFYVSMNKLFHKPSRYRWFEMPFRSYHCNDNKTVRMSVTIDRLGWRAGTSLICPFIRLGGYHVSITSIDCFVVLLPWIWQRKCNQVVQSSLWNRQVKCCEEK